MSDVTDMAARQATGPGGQQDRQTGCGSHKTVTINRTNEARPLDSLEYKTQITRIYDVTVNGVKSDPSSCEIKRNKMK